MKISKLKFKRSTIILIILLLISNAASMSCRSQKNTMVKIGVLYPMTGDLADKGIDSIRALQMAADEINESGGIRSMDGALIELVYADTKGNPETGSAETERLIIHEKVTAIIGTYQSSVTKAATQIAERHETPFIVSISLADIITERGFRYTFRVQPKAEYYCRDQVQFLSDYSKVTRRKIKRVALLHENTDFGTSTSLAQKKALTARGYEISSDVSYVAEGVKDLGHAVRKVLASNPDAILTVTYFNDSILIFRELSARSITLPVIDTAGGTVSSDFISTMGRDAENIFTSAEYSKFTNTGRDINRKFRMRYGIDITGDSAYAYQSMFVIKDALERSGSSDRQRLREYIAATDMNQGEKMILPAERIRFNHEGQNEFARLYIVQIQNGEYIPVWPAEYAAGRIKY
ncbi:MAG TPA: ABC transporter substrate-binding protein [Spirochaetota bacterium]|nr:ABC transporter substrate-binding protein [Spirochaetota bacterium]HQO39511.1 ABC transporter substrate-binding protein [Spirochaetota bacterium]